jgi:hypothetical protein
MAWPKRLNGARLCPDMIFGAKAINGATQIDDKLSTNNVNQFTLGGNGNSQSALSGELMATKAKSSSRAVLFVLIG